MLDQHRLDAVRMKCIRHSGSITDPTEKAIAGRIIGELARASNALRFGKLAAALVHIENTRAKARAYQIVRRTTS